MKELAVVLASGGLDSCVSAAIAHERWDLAMLHLSYGQRTQTRERRAFDDLADFFHARHRLATQLDHLRLIGGSSLTDPTMEVAAANLDAQEVPNSYVPFRNAHLLTVAVSWAEVIGARRIFFGAVEEDSSGYPDCREAFIQAFNHLIRLGTKPETDIVVETPLLHLDKRAIVERGLALKAPLHLTWSCYQREDKACGNCDSCALRLRGFYRAGRQDPVTYLDEKARDRFQ